MIFAGNIFNSPDPFHNLVKDFLEIPVEFLFLLVGFIMPLVAYGATFLVNHAIIAGFLMLVDIFLVEYWFDIAMPEKVAGCFFNDSQLHTFQTAKLSEQTKQNLIILYRTFQPYNSLCNVNLSTSRFASHSVGAMAVAIFGSFTLIRYSHIFKSLSELPLICIMSFATIFPIFIYSVECNCVDSLVKRSFTYRNTLLKINKARIENIDA